MKNTVILLIITPLLLSSCAGWRRVEKPPEIIIPDKFIQADSLGAYLDDPWWIILDDPALNKYIEEVYAANPDIQASAARLEQFRQQLISSRASFFPSLSASLSGGASDFIKEQNTGNSAQSLFRLPDFSSNLTAAYELDIWGKLKAGRDASNANYIASGYDLKALALTLSLTAARTYFYAAELKLQLRTLDNTVESYQANFDFISERYFAGTASALDYYQSKTSLESAMSGRAMADASLITTKHALAALAGKYPEEDVIAITENIPVQSAFPLPSIPSELLKRRPDIQAAFYRLQAADRRAAEAVAMQYPSFNLTGSISASGDDLTAALNPDNLIWRALANVTLPLFQGGRLRANAKQAEAAWEAEKANYKSTLIKAFQEVEDALVKSRKYEESARHLEAQVAAAEASLRIATDQYFQGVIDYLQVVVAQSNYLKAKSGLITAQRQLVEVRIQLAAALGGGWTDEIIEKLEIHGNL